MFRHFWKITAVVAVSCGPALSQSPEPSAEDMLLSAAVIKFIDEHCGGVGLAPMHDMAAGLVEQTAPEGAVHDEYDRISSLIARKFNEPSSACASLQRSLAPPTQ